MPIAKPYQKTLKSCVMVKHFFYPLSVVVLGLGAVRAAGADEEYFAGGVCGGTEWAELPVPTKDTPLAPKCPSRTEDSPGRQLRNDRTVALLEKYSEMLLLRMTEKGAQATLE